MPTGSTWSGSPSVRGPTESVQIALLTFVLIGMVFVWGTEMTYCTPYLLQLGLTKSTISLVWTAGPASGLIVQPVVGAIADRSTSRYGRRRPFIVCASIMVGIALLLLGWTSEFVGIFVSEESTKKNITIGLAVLCIWVVDFSINAVQACSRALLVDTLPVSKQSLGAAWDVRMGAAGHVAVSLIGRLDLTAIFPTWFGGDTQFKKMTVFATIALWCAVGVTTYAVTERVLLSTGYESSKVVGVGRFRSAMRSTKSTIFTIVHRILNLPTRIQAICWVQFWCWIGWFPFLFYNSTWVGETYYRYEHPPEAGDTSEDLLGNIGRLGSTALGIFSVVILAASIVLPRLVKASRASDHEQRPPAASPPKPHPLSFQLADITHSLLGKAAQHRPDVVTTWIIGELVFAGIMMWAPLVRSVAVATLLVSLAGVPWAIGIWAPFAEIGMEINRLASDDTAVLSGSGVAAPGGYAAVRLSIDDDEDEPTEMESGRPERSGSHHRRRSSSGVLRLQHPDDEDVEAISSTGELSGIYLGVLNVYTTLPQFVGTAISWVVFSILEPSRNKSADDSNVDGGSAGQDGHEWLDLANNGKPNAISVCLFIGAICAVIAAEAARRLRKLK